MKHAWFVSAALVAALPAPLWAAGSPNAAAVDVQTLVIQKNAELAQVRVGLAPVFEEAYLQHPELPEGVLESLAWVGSRWSHRMPEAELGGHHDMPQTYGVMGLYHGQGGFGDAVTDAARALGVTPDQVMSSPEINIMATAALLAERMRAAGLSGASPEALVPVLRGLTGLPSEGNTNRFAQDSFAFDVLLAMDRGISENGAVVPEIPIFWADAFDAQTLRFLNAPTLRIAVDDDLVLLPDGTAFNPAVAALQPRAQGDVSKTNTTDYPPALWVASPNYSSRNGTAITHVAIHTCQGGYSGCVSWCANPDADVSAHYIMRSSDGQVTQMVREADKAWHVGSENPYTIGIEHEGYVSDPSWYTTALYNSSSALVKDICADNNIDCNSCYDGPSSSSVSVQSSSYHVKGHQHYPNQTHTDPGIYWNWPNYADLVSSTTGGGGGPTLPGGFPGGGGGGMGGMLKTVIDDFEVSEGHFDLQPTYSGSTVGISTASTADRSSAQAHGGSYSEKLSLKDDTTSSSNWQVRFLSASGNPAANVAFSATRGSIGFWAYTAASGVTAAPLVDDSDGLEQGAPREIPAGKWTYLSWSVADSSQWAAWFQGNGALNASTVTLDAINFYRAQTSATVDVYIDDVTYSRR